jgi:hypothetical protein
VVERGSGGGQGRREEPAHGLALYDSAMASARRGGTDPRGVGAGSGGEEQRWSGEAAATGTGVSSCDWVLRMGMRR